MDHFAAEALDLGRDIRTEGGIRILGEHAPEGRTGLILVAERLPTQGS